MIDYSKTYEQIGSTSLEQWMDVLPNQVTAKLNSPRWGDLPKWLDVVKRLPDVNPSSIDLNVGSVRIGQKEDCDAKVREELEKTLRELHPWRKGPFEIFGTSIDTEWRSDLKWDRFKNEMASLNDRLVLDVGCGNGYHCWRMKGAGAKLVVGIDPTMLYPIQFEVFQKYIQDPSVVVFPLGVDDMPENLNRFDTVFSMGLLYHRRAPFDHLLQLKSFLREGGELVLETLVIDGKLGEVLSPEGRYAKMPNVWFIPSIPTLESWIKRMGFTNVRCVDVTKTTPEEQRVTDWMDFQSLSDFLDPNDSTKTIEGYPAPQRAVFLVNNS